MLGRAMSDIQRMSGEFDPPQNDADGEYAVLNDTAPVGEMRDYAMDYAWDGMNSPNQRS